MVAKGNWKEISRLKQAERLSKIPNKWIIPEEFYKGRTNVTDIPVECGILTEKEIHITSDYDATALLENLRAGSFSAEEVTVAFCKRAAIAQQLTNCLTEIFFEDAIKIAKQLDAEREANSLKPLPPFWGLPISLKDSFKLPGIDASCGMASPVNEPSTEYSTLSGLLVELGAVLYTKTNVPQTLMTADSENNVFGRTVNPHNLNLTAGGSTGGEGALIALRGSILAGSIRIPALANGIYGFKPSIGVVPYSRQRKLSVPGVEGVKPVAGPMATSIRDVQLFLREVIKAGPWKYDSGVNRTIWQGLDVPPKESITIGVAEDDGVFTPHPPVRRALQEAVGKMKAAGVKVVPIELPQVAKKYEQLLKYFKAAGSGPWNEMLDATGEPYVTSVQLVSLVTGGKEATLQEYLQLFVDRENAQTQVRDLFLEHNLTALLSPGAPHVALPHDLYKDVTYTGLWNYVDHPAVILPTGHVKPTDLVDEPWNAKYDNIDSKVYGYYTDPDDFRDAPTVIQLVGYRQQDEELATVAILIDSIINNKQDPRA